LRRAEAEARAALLTVWHLSVQLDLTRPDAFLSRTVIAFAASTPGASTFLDFRGRELRSVTLNGEPLDPGVWRDGRIPLSRLSASNEVVVEGLMDYSTNGEGLHRHVDPADGATYLYAMSFLDAAPCWFACFDQPDLKARYTLEVTAPPAWTVIGNGPSVALAPGRWRIEPLTPLSTYFVTLVAGPYASVHDEHDGIALGCHVRASLGAALQAEADDLFTVTKQAMDYYHRLFGVRYPFGEYHQAFVPDFNAGAMENPGCVTVRDEYIYRARATTDERASRAGVIAHELAHMWFGDLVTMRWWDDLWLNESFAEYMAHRCCTEATAYPLWTEFGIVRKDWGAVADQSAATHPVAGTGSADAASALQDFDGISYAKGAAVLRQLVTHLGDEVFLGGLRLHFAAHAYGNADFADLLDAWSRAGAQGLHEWAEAWLRSPGMDTLQIRSTDGTTTLARVPPARYPANRPHSLQVAALDRGGAELARAAVRVQTAAAPVPAPDGTVLLVPDAGDETWAKIRPGPGGWAAVGPVLEGLTDPACRVVLINAVRDAVRDAELDPAEALEILCGAGAAEGSDVVLTSVLTFAVDVLAGPYCPLEEQAARTARVAEACEKQLVRAGPGSDRQLAAFRLVARTTVDADRLRRWRAGAALPPGLRLDPELTWALVHRLTLLTGEAALIDETQAADPSAAATVHAARARAALPEAAAKERAWQLLATPSDLGAYQLYATAEGFFAPAQEALTDPYVPRYFAEIPATASFRTGWVLGRLAALAFPGRSATPRTLALAEATLARADLAGPIRRAVVEGTDRLGRAVAARTRFG